MELPEDNTVGLLYIVGTPIGNMGDITVRALQVLAEVDLIAAEDTRRTQKLLNHYSVKKPVTSYYEHNKRKKGQLLIEELLKGKSIALVSDAGMPGISDPGSDLVKDCIKEGITVNVIPGPCAFVAALVASGLDTGKFVYAGFCPSNKGERKKFLTGLSREEGSVVFYESPHRLRATLKEAMLVFGDRKCCVAREMTKIYEQYHRGMLSEVIAEHQETPFKGEMTVVVEGYIEKEPERLGDEEVDALFAEMIARGCSKKDAVKELSGITTIPKRELYERFMKNQPKKQTP